MTAAAFGFGDLIAGVLFDLAVADKLALFAALCDAAGDASGIAASTILERVSEREALGSTGFGNGTAIPHARIAGLDRVRCIVARLAVPIDYGSLDGEAVDIAVLLLSPEGAGADHLKALARISRALRSTPTLAALRGAGDADAVLASLGALAHAA